MLSMPFRDFGNCRAYLERRNTLYGCKDFALLIFAQNGLVQQSFQFTAKKLKKIAT